MSTHKECYYVHNNDNGWLYYDALYIDCSTQTSHHFHCIIIMILIVFITKIVDTQWWYKILC